MSYEEMRQMLQLADLIKGYGGVTGMHEDSCYKFLPQLVTALETISL